MPKKSISNLSIIAIIASVILIIIFLTMALSFSKKVKTTDEIASVNKCKLPGTNNYCCEPYSDNVITPKKGGWSDCSEPLNACCIG